MKLAFEIPLVFTGQNHIDDVPWVTQLFEAGAFAGLGFAVFALVVADEVGFGGDADVLEAEEGFWRKLITDS